MPYKDPDGRQETKKMRRNGMLLIAGILMAMLFIASGCGNAQISPEDAAKANEYTGNTLDFPVIINVPEEEMTSLEKGDILQVQMQEFPYEDLVSPLFDLSGDQIDALTEVYDQKNESGEVIGWAKVLRYGNGYFGLAESGRYAWFSKEISTGRLFDSLIQAGRLSGTAYYRFFLLERFTQEGLDALPAQQVIDECNGYMEIMGFSEYEADIYAIDIQTLREIDSQFEISPEGRDWEDEDESYLLLYHPYYDQMPIYSINAENDIRFIYSVTNGVIDVETGYHFGEVLSRETVDLVTVEQALLQIEGLASELGLQGTQLEITGVSLGYIAKMAQQNPTQGIGILTPCYGITGVLTDDEGQQREGVFLVDATTGYGITW